MSKLVQRLLIFFIGIPAVLLIVLLSKFNHLLLHIALLGVIIIALNEIYGILKTKGHLQPKLFLAILSLVPTVVSYLYISFNFSSFFVYFSFVICSLLIMTKEVFFPTDKGENNFEKSIYSIISGLFIIFYVGLLPSFISRLSGLENSVWYLSLYFVMTFICDSFAWLFGMTLGKGLGHLVENILYRRQKRVDNKLHCLLLNSLLLRYCLLYLLVLL